MKLGPFLSVSTMCSILKHMTCLKRMILFSYSRCLLRNGLGRSKSAQRSKAVLITELQKGHVVLNHMAFFIARFLPNSPFTLLWDLSILNYALIRNRKEMRRHAVTTPQIVILNIS